MSYKLLAPSWLKDLAGAWVFYTVLPQWVWPKPKFDRIARFAPLIGLIIGGLQSTLWLALDLMHWPKSSSVLLVIAFGAWITGGIHFDGLMDTADGLAAGKERCLQAMKDSRVGASGVICLLIIVFLQIGALLKINDLIYFALPVAAFWGRCAPILAMRNFNYLREENEFSSFQSRNFKNIWDTVPALLSLLISLSFLYFISSKSPHFEGFFYYCNKYYIFLI